LLNFFLICAAGPVTPAAREAAASLRENRHSSYRSYSEFQRSREKLLRTATRRRLQSTAVDFQRMWWDKDARAPSKAGLSLWRPRPAPGYISLGKCSHMRWVDFQRMTHVLCSLIQMVLDPALLTKLSRVCGMFLFNHVALHLHQCA
jgi:hypothetical protein